MLILGIGALLHDPSVAILQDGRIRFAIESEKVTRHHKEISVLPVEAIDFALTQIGASLEDVDLVVTNWDPRPHRHLFYIPNILKYISKGALPFRHLGVLLSISGALSRSSLEMNLRVPRVPPIRYVRHHLAHLGCSYTLSSFESAAVAIIDGAGEYDSTSLYQCNGRDVRKIWSCGLPFNSLGTVFAMGTQHLGFRMLGDEYKVMALAALGEPNRKFRDFFDRLIQLESDGRYHVNGRLLGDFLLNGYYFPKRTHEYIDAPRPSADALQQVHYDFAREMQQKIGDTVCHVLRHLRKKSGMRKLCLGGGLAMNSVINGRILREGIFDEVFIPPGPHDGGTALGAAAYHSYHVLGHDRPSPLVHAYLGPVYSTESVRETLETAGAHFEEMPDVAQGCARLLADGLIVGWFQGAAEFGPRALGSRSILADPRLEKNRHRVSEIIKGREGFRPLAPSILEESMSDYFPNSPPSPFMSWVDVVAENLREQIPAAVHFDGTARPQTISKQHNPLFHDMVRAFQGITGVPAVINTSFNVSGEPIVMTPEDAVRTFFASRIDALVIDRFLVRKN
jgi:carbamoyltransferase